VSGDLCVVNESSLWRVPSYLIGQISLYAHVTQGELIPRSSLTALVKSNLLPKYLSVVAMEAYPSQEKLNVARSNSLPAALHKTTHDLRKS
jgi:hypothetical protein